MFNTHRRQVPLRRRAAALLATQGVAGALLALLVNLGGQAPAPVRPAELPQLVEYIGKEALPPGPPAAAPGGPGPRHPAPAPTAAPALPAPVEPPAPEAPVTDAIPELPPAPEAPAAQAPAAGAPGAGAGRPGGPAGAGIGGGGGIGGRGGGGGGPARVDSVQVRRQVAPVFPAAAAEMGIEARCKVHFTIDDRGRPTAVRVSDCPAVFRPAVEEAAWKWRFYPARIDGRRRPARFVLSVRFELR